MYELQDISYTVEGSTTDERKEEEGQMICALEEAGKREMGKHISC